jgi:hypothetical protein
LYKRALDAAAGGILLLLLHWRQGVVILGEVDDDAAVLY